jgi:ferrous iron transport protein B
MSNIVLAGNPNCGKTAIFNLLTGLKQKVSNLAGTTVEAHKGSVNLNNIQYQITDLPGTYSFYPNSFEEKVSIDYLIENKKEIDLLVYVADANQLFRNLLFFGQLSDLKIPTLLIVNMWDTDKGFENKINLPNLKDQLGIEVFPFSAKKHMLFPSLKKTVEMAIQEGSISSYFDHSQSTEQLLEHSDSTNQKERANHTLFIYKRISELFGKKEIKESSKENMITTKWDNILMHPVWGFVVFALVMFIVFQAIFVTAEAPMNAIDSLFTALGGWIENVLPKENLLVNLIINGIIPGIAGVLIFVPQILILFLLLGILEDTGYISRISFLLDSVLKKVGLNGKSVIPMVGGFACAIPAIMSARTIGNKKERLITMLITPLMACSARLPVYTVLISLLFISNSSTTVDQRGLIFFLLYTLGIVVALVVSAILNKFIKNKNDDFMVIEMPSYRIPIIRNVAQSAWLKTLQFIKGAGLIIFIVSIVLWALASFGPPQKMAEVHQKYSQYNLKENPEMNSKKNSDLLANSYAGHLGQIIEPAIKPLGYDWKIGIAIITSFAAREVFIGTISTIYAIESDKNELIVDRLRNAKREDGTPVYTKATIISLLLFYAFALQCMSTIAVMKRETGGWKWPIFQFIYMGVLAYLAAFIAFQTIA